MSVILAAFASVPAPIYVFAVVAGLVRGFTGFGAALTFVPMAATVLGPQLAVATIVTIDATVQSAMWPEAWRKADRKAVLPLLAGAVIGAPIGVSVLVLADPLKLRWFMACTVIAALAVVLSGWRMREPPGRAGSAAVGLVSGFFNGAATLGGLIAATFWLAGRGANETIRASLVLYLAFLTVIAVINLSVVGILTVERALAAVPLIPLYAAGIWGGVRLFRAFGDATFRQAAYALVAAGAAISVPALDGWLR